MADTRIPERTTSYDDQCWCLLVHPDDSEVSCLATVGPDQPFCDMCESRHPDYDAQGVKVTTRVLV